MTGWGPSFGGVMKNAPGNASPSGISGLGASAKRMLPERSGAPSASVSAAMRTSDAVHPAAGATSVAFIDQNKARGSDPDHVPCSGASPVALTVPHASARNVARAVCTRGRPHPVGRLAVTVTKLRA